MHEPTSTPSAADLRLAGSRLLAALRTRAPRVQCLTNTVAQAITANVLHAVGVRASMATHAAEVAAMSGSADAVLVNLGTMDAAREAAIPIALEAATSAGRPIVLDPVFADASPLRMTLARSVLAAPGVIVKGNEREMSALAAAAPGELARADARVTTGAVDRIDGGDRVVRIANGHPFMAAITGLGCAAGALIGAFRTVETDPVVAAASALLCLGVAGEIAGERAAGPGSFAVAILDVLHRLDAETITNRGRLA